MAVCALAAVMPAVAVGAADEEPLPVGTVIIANGWSQSDSAVAAVLAAAASGADGTQRAVVLFASFDRLPSRTAGAIAGAKPAEIVLVGGTAALAPIVAAQAAQLVPAANIRRIAGATREATAAEAAPAGAQTVIVANGRSSADVGVAAALAAVTGDSAVLFARTDALTDPTAAFVRAAAPARIVLVGGTAALSETVAADLRALAPNADISRRTGATRTATAAESVGTHTEVLVMANGWSPPDTAVAAALAATTHRAAVAYAAAHTLTDDTAQLVSRLQPRTVVIIGGVSAVAATVRSEIGALAPDAHISRIAGVDRIHTAVLAAGGSSDIDAADDDGDIGGGGGSAGGGGPSGGGSDNTGDDDSGGSPSPAPYNDPTLAPEYHDPEPYPGANDPHHDLNLTAPAITDVRYGPAEWGWTNTVWRTVDGTATNVTVGVGDSYSAFCGWVGIPTGDPCDWHLNWALWACQRMAAGVSATAFADEVLDMLSWHSTTGKPNGTIGRVQSAISGGVRFCADSPQNNPDPDIWDFNAVESPYWQQRVDTLNFP